jgi:hypothetical protein
VVGGLGNSGGRFVRCPCSGNRDSIVSLIRIPSRGMPVYSDSTVYVIDLSGIENRVEYGTALDFAVRLFRPVVE